MMWTDYGLERASLVSMPINIGA